MIRVSQTGASPSNCRSIGPRNTRQSARPPHDHVRREPREAAPERLAPVAHSSTRIRSSRPGFTPNISDAFPPLIAIATFRYESS